MSRKLNRWLLAGALVAGVVAPMLSAQAAGPGIDVANNQYGNGKLVQVLPGQEVTWHIIDGTHTVSADPEAGGQKWPAKDSGDLEQGKSWPVTFTTPGTYNYRCEQVKEMKGSILVRDDSTTTTTAPPVVTPTTAAPTTTTTSAQVVPGPTTTTTSAPATSAGARPSGPAAPAPTTTTVKKGKDDKKEDETTTTTVAPPPPPIDLPDSAIIPVLPSGATGSTTQDGSIQNPTDTPEGDAIALLKSKKSGGQATKLLILSGFGLGALGLGTAGYKYANRSSKYFPA